MSNDMNIILAGVVGSTAYGLNHAGSDVDMLGVYQAWTVDVLGVKNVEQTKVGSDPDWQAHELGKFIKLVAECNPTVTELLWLPDELYAVRGIEGDMLIGFREAFLCQRAFASFGGYAKQQFERLKRTGKFDSDKDSFEKRSKHGRHLARLLIQGTELCTTGKLTVRLTPDQVAFCRQVGGDAAEGNTDLILDLLEGYADLKEENVLPEAPDWDKIDNTLVHLRMIDLDNWAA